MLALIANISSSETMSAESQAGIEKPIPSVKPEGSPQIQFDELYHDFGKVFQNKSFEHVFTFKNTGTANLNIIKVKAG
jgi:hypothetical protein